MARHPRIEACMFCDAFPCECLAAKKAPAPRKRAAKKTADDEVVLPDPIVSPAPVNVDIAAAMRAEASVETHRIEEAKPTDETEQAIRMLEPILHPSERELYKNILTTDPSDRAKRWRERRGE